MEINYSGNLKIGPDTAILNMTSATDCPSRARGLCAHCKICYARRAEVFRPAVLPYRRRQARQWQAEEAPAIAEEILKHKKIKFLRYSEAGDFPAQKDVDKMSRLADILGQAGVKVYGYTARIDLDFSKVSDNMTVNGSGFRVHNEFRIVEKYQKGPGIFNCPGNCRSCKLCTTRKQIRINVEKH